MKRGWEVLKCFELLIFTILKFTNCEEYLNFCDWKCKFTNCAECLVYWDWKCKFTNCEEYLVY